MCDTFCHVDADGTWFAKNSDRPPDEVQLVHSWPRRQPGGLLRTQYLDLGVDPGACALFVASQPTWLWGLEHGVNEHRVAVGNETVYTTDDRWSAPPALLGMDLVRLTLERSRDADEARAALTTLLEQYGQGGSGWQGANEPYFSSFLIADPTAAWIIETSQRSWVARRVDRGGAAVSNRLSLSTDWVCASADIAPGADWQSRRDPKAPTGIADHRLAVTTSCVSDGANVGLAAIIAALRDHGPSRPALPVDVEPDWSGVSVCMHVRGYQATTSSLVCRLPRDPNAPVEHWIALGSPCVSVYVPAFGGDLPPELSDAVTWQRFAALRDRVEADPTRHEELHAVRTVLDPVEQELWAAAREGDPTWPAQAFALVDAALRRLQA